MISFRTHQVVAGITTEVGFQEFLSFRQRDMHLVHCTSGNRHANSLTFQDMTTSLAIRGQEVEMVSGDAERSGKSWRPKTNKCALLIFEIELLLSRGSRLEASPLWDNFHDSRLHEGKPTLDPEGIKQVFRRTESIAYRNEFGEAIDLPGRPRELGTETSHNRIRDEAVSLHIRNCSIGRHSVTHAFQNNHFPIEVDKCAEAEVPMTQQPRDPDRPLVKPLDERRRCRNLEQGMNWVPQTLGERHGYHMVATCLVGFHSLR